MAKLKIKKTNNVDLKILTAIIENFSKQWDFWEACEVLKTLQRTNCRGYLAYEEPLNSVSQVKGFIFYSVFMECADLLFVYIPHSGRKKGVAQDLLEQSLNFLAVDNHVQRILLEVRVSNQAAIKLYQKLGFEQIDLRKSYYKDGESALVFSKDL